jgi:hypothetical protein
LPKEIDMSTIRRSRTLGATVAAVLALTLVAPIAVTADDPVIAAAEQGLVAVPAAASWDELSGYGSVEASRAANALAAVPVAFTSQVPSDVRWAPARALEHTLDPLEAAAMAWDETSGYGAVEASRAQR